MKRWFWRWNVHRFKNLWRLSVDFEQSRGKNNFNPFGRCLCYVLEWYQSINKYVRWCTRSVKTYLPILLILYQIYIWFEIFIIIRIIRKLIYLLAKDDRYSLFQLVIQLEWTRSIRYLVGTSQIRWNPLNFNLNVYLLYRLYYFYLFYHLLLKESTLFMKLIHMNHSDGKNFNVHH